MSIKFALTGCHTGNLSLTPSMVGYVWSGNGARQGTVSTLGNLIPIQEPAMLISLLVPPKSLAIPYRNFGDPTEHFACHTEDEVGSPK